MFEIALISGIAWLCVLSISAVCLANKIKTRRPRG